MRPSSSDPKYLLVFWINGRALQGKDQHIRLRHYKRQRKECTKLNNSGNHKVLKWKCKNTITLKRNRSGIRRLVFLHPCNTPVSVVRFWKTFLTFVESSGWAVWHYILWKCFSQVLCWKCGSFLDDKDDTDSTHFRIDTCGRAHSACPDIPYLSECGGLCRLSIVGSFHNLQQDERKSAPHFLCI